MPEALSTTQIETYRRDGCLVVENRLSQTWVTRLHGEIARFDREARNTTVSNERLDRQRRNLFFEMMAADAVPIIGSMTSCSRIEDDNSRMLCGETTLTPRLTDIPIRMPHPQPDVPISICEIQKGRKKRAYNTIPKQEI